ncbi:MAG TPA: hypothetical protein VD866_30020 [Urbifossiella sp.]|jgi:hypothetical protein|nr:hypothetical protein [Urbifossiella sp.]
MDPIRSFDDPDPVQRYMRRAAGVKLAVVAAAVVLLAVGLYWGVSRWL